MRKILFFMACLLSFGVAASLQDIKEQGVVRFGIYDDNIPFSKMHNGELKGFDVDFANQIAKDLFAPNVGKVDFVVLTAPEKVSFLERDKVDIVISNFERTPQNEASVDFTSPFFSTNLAILTRKEDGIRHITDLKNKKIIVQSGTAAETYFKDNAYDLVTCAVPKECYKKLKSGQGAAYAGSNFTVLAYPVVDKSLEVKLKNIGPTHFLGLGVKKGNQELLQFLNVEIRTLSKNGFFQEAYEKTFLPFYRNEVEKNHFLIDDVYNLFK